MDALELVTSILKKRVRPVLVERGFRGTGATLRRPIGEAIQVVRLQRDTRNTAWSARLFLNGGCYLPALDSQLGRPVLSDPGESSCHVRMRPNDVVAGVEQFYEVTPATGVDELSDQIVRHLAAMLAALDELSTSDAAADWLAERRLTEYEVVFGWYLGHHRTADARRFVTGLHDHFGDQARWAIFAARLDAVAAQAGSSVDWRDWLDVTRPETA